MKEIEENQFNADNEIVNAILQDRIDIVKTLCILGVSIDVLHTYDDVPVLHFCLEKNRLEMFKCLLEFNASLMVKNQEGVTVSECLKREEYAPFRRVAERFSRQAEGADAHSQVIAAARDVRELEEKMALEKSSEKNKQPKVPVVLESHSILSMINSDMITDDFLAEFVAIDNPFDYRDQRGNGILHLLVRHNKVLSLVIVLQHLQCNDHLGDVNLAQQTLLHLAAIHDAKDAFAVLIKNRKIPFDARCAMGMTVLHYAAQYGRYGIIQQIPRDVYDNDVVELLNKSDLHGKLACHYAASQNHSMPCLKWLCENEEIASAFDRKRNTPLHYAVIYQLEENVRFLVTLSKLRLDAPNIEGLSALDYALRLRHRNIAKCLINALADRDSQSYWALIRDQGLLEQTLDVLMEINNPMACNEAYSPKLNAHIRLLLGLPLAFDERFLKQLYPNHSMGLMTYSPKLLNSLESQLPYLLSLATTQQQPFLQVLYLRKLGEVSLFKNNYYHAMQFFQSALALFRAQQKTHPLKSLHPDEQHILDEISRVRVLHAQSLGFTLTDAPSHFEQIRSELKEARARCMHFEFDQIQSACEVMTQCYRNILTRLILNYADKIGFGVANIAVVLCGSVARSETSLFSDLEFFILTTNGTPQEIQSIHKWIQLVEMDILSCGETSFPILNNGRVSALPSGFCLDPHGIAPRGKVDWLSNKTLSDYQLIGSPSQLAKLVNEQKFSENRELVVSLCTTDLLLGNKSLYQQFQVDVQTQLDGQTSWFDSVFKYLRQPKRSLRERMSNECLLAMMSEFQPKLDGVKAKDQFFMVKIELYRVIERLLSSLALKFDYSGQSAWQRIAYFSRNGVFPPATCLALQEALNRILALRFRVQRHYGNEFDGIWHINMLNDHYVLPHQLREEEIYIISPYDIEQLLSIYQVILPITEAIKDYSINNYDTKLLNNLVLDQDDSQSKAMMMLNLYKYQEASTFSLKALVIDPNNLQLVFMRLKSLLMRGKYAESLDYVEQVLVKQVNKKNTQTLYYFKLLQIAAVIYSQNGVVNTAIKYLEEALSIVKSRYPYSVDYYDTLVKLGTAYHRNEMIEKALDFYDQAAELEKLISIPCDMLTVRLNARALMLCDREAYDEALALIEEGITLLKNVTRDVRVEIETLYRNKAYILLTSGHPREALKIFQQSLLLCKEFYGEIHPHVESILGNIAYCYFDMDKIDIAIKHFSEALEIVKKVYKGPHWRFGQCYRGLTLAYRKNGQPALALNAAKDAVAADLKYYGNTHHKYRQRLYDLAEIALDLDINLFSSTSEKIFTLIDNEDEQQAFLFNMMLTLHRHHQPDLAITYGERVLKYNIPPDRRPFLHNNLAALYEETGNEESAAYHYLISLELRPDEPIFLCNYGIFLRDHGNVGTSIPFLRRAYERELELHGPRDNRLGGRLLHLGVAYDMHADFVLAKESFDQAYQILRTLQGEMSPMSQRAKVFAEKAALKLVMISNKLLDISVSDGTEKSEEERQQIAMLMDYLLQDIQPENRSPVIRAEETEEHPAEPEDQENDKEKCILM